MALTNPVLDALDAVLYGKRDTAALLYASLLADGHVLLEDVPGVGKTTLAHAMADAVGLSFKRIQCTNDTLPSDIIGASLWNPAKQEFVFKSGPVFTSALVVDEINRASPKTQSALLEAMEEGQVTVDGETRMLPKPFWVVATQNPSDHAGTAPLPESQLDRFLIKISVGYPDEASEKQMLRRDRSERRVSPTKVDGLDLVAARASVQTVTINDAVLDYLYRLVVATRNPQVFELGLSPRASQGLLSMARAWAWLSGRNHVTPDDVKAVFPAVATHRVQPTMSKADVSIKQLLNDVHVSL